ncbi:hypothetical protein PF327_11270 [Sulfurovum sp. XTW-4]|uniref:Uncharacterized protein n=1 Tax=Sulfurovum xiamenensis TaxID=3019066 RepID=A0ABT7QUL8_9BACT|nr:hypothetical protein [Sulfurovum xiamenensis]MDM5264775.1 hypothetical protein [Sulfurovum xiamenensis]
MIDATILTNYRSINIGIRVDIPHEKITIITVNFMFWSLMIIFGAKIGRK